MPKQVVLNCCKDPKEGVTNCPTLSYMDDGRFVLKDDDGQWVALSTDQMNLLITAATDMMKGG
jgi:hypothetical protein